MQLSFTYPVAQFLCSLHDAFHNTADSNGNKSCAELSADGVIMDLAYSPERCFRTY